MKRVPIEVAVAVTVLASPLVAVAATPWETHGALQVAPNGRRLQHADGTPFFYLADTAWEIATRMEFNAETPHGRGIEYYLDDRVARGINVIQAPVIAPLTGPTGANVVGQKFIVSGTTFNPDNLNEAYMQRVDAVLAAAAARGMYVALLPTWGSNVNSGLIDAAKAERYGEVLAARYKDRKNIIWTLGGDIVPDGFEPVWNAMAKGIANGLAGTQGQTPDYSQALMTFHPAGGRSSSSHTLLGPWLDFNSMQTSHSDPKQPESATYNRHFDRPQVDWNQATPKPFINTEPPYENITIGLTQDGTKPRHGPYELRLSAYWSVLGGAAGHTYGHNNIWQAHDLDHGYAPQFGANAAWEDSLDTAGVAQMTTMKSLVLSRPYGESVRDNSLLANYAALSTGKTVSSSVASRGDDYAMFYTGNGSSMNVNMGKIAGANVKAWWFDPRSGQATEIGTFANSGVQTFDPAGAPGHDNDWVLVLSDALAQHPAPGEAVDQSAFRPLHEDFAYLHRYNNGSTNGSAKVNASGGRVTLDSGLASASQRATLVAHRRDFNFFDQVLQVGVEEITIGGEAGSGANSLFVVIGDGAGNDKALYPGADLNNGLSFEIRRSSAGVMLAFMEVVNRVNANQGYTLSGLPTDMQIVLNGQERTWQVILTGEALADGRQVIHGAWNRLTEANIPAFGMALGAYNAGAVGTSTVVSVGGLSLTAVVPEPAALTTGMALGAMGLLRRRRGAVAAGVN